MQFNFWGGRYIYAEYDYTMDPDSFWGSVWDMIQGFFVPCRKVFGSIGVVLSPMKYSS